MADETTVPAVVLIDDPDLCNDVREHILPACDQWAESGRTAKELILRDRAMGLTPRLMALAQQHGEDAEIPIGRSKCRIKDVLAVIRTGATVNGYLETADVRQKGLVPADSIYRVARATK